MALAQPEPRQHETGTHPKLDQAPSHEPSADVVPLPQTALGDAPLRESGEHQRAPEPSAQGETPAQLQPAPDAAQGDPPTAAVEETSAAAAAPPRPPVLASEVLREDIEPTEPGRGALRVVGTAAAPIGIAMAAALGGATPLIFGVVAGFVLIGTLCVTPIRYAVRAWSVLGAASAAVVLTTVARLAAGGPPEAPVLALGSIVLGGGLLFRSRYRASKIGRMVIACGIAVLTLWFLLAGGLSGLAQLDSTWQSWAPAMLRIAFGLLLLLSLLAFMSANSTGGTQLWGTVLLACYAAHVGVQVSIRHAPLGGQPVAMPDALSGATAASTLLVVVAAMALAHVLAVIAGGTVERRRAETERTAA